MKLSDLLIASRTLIAHERNWTRGVGAKYKFFPKQVRLKPFLLENAIWVYQFCSLGALAATCEIRGVPIAEREKAVVYLNQYMWPTVYLYNDTHSHEDVLEAWDSAIHERIQFENGIEKADIVWNEFLCRMEQKKSSVAS